MGVGTGSEVASSPVERRPSAGQPLTRANIALAVAAAVALVSVGLYLAAIATHPRRVMLQGFDLNVYLTGGWLAQHEPGQLYLWHQPGHPGIQFTYTPFAALVFEAARVVPFHGLMDLLTLVSVAALAATVWIAFRELGWRPRERTAATLALAGVALWLEPVQRALGLGQIEPLLMVMITWDLCQPDRRRWKGAMTGLAAGMWLTPLPFIAYLALIRRFRQAAVAAGAFAATVVIAWAALPGPSVSWWLHGDFFRASRTGFVGDLQNQSLRGTLTRLAGSVSAGQPAWLAVAVVVGILGLAAAAVLYRGGHQFAGLLACALTVLLTSPISWDHHWVWIVPGLALMVDAARRANGLARAAWLAVAVVAAAAFGGWPDFWSRSAGLLNGGLINYAPQTSFGHGDNPAYVEYHWHGLQLVAGNLYVLIGAALFVIALAAAARALRVLRGLPGTAPARAV